MKRSRGPAGESASHAPLRPGGAGRATRWRSRAACALLAIGLAALPATAVLAVDKVTAAGLFKDRAILVIDGRQRLLRAGQTSPEGVTLVSASSERAVVEIDGERSTLALGNAIGSSFRAPESKIVQIYPSDGNRYETPGSINGFPVRFIVDTGATLVVLNEPQARRLGIDFRVVGEPAVAVTAQGTQKTYLVRLDRVRVGDIELRNVDAAVNDGAFPPSVLLGMSFLERVDMRREGRVLQLEQRL